MFRLISLAIISVISIYAIDGTSVEKVITGKITHTGANSIDNDAQIQVELRDVSLMDTASKVIASTTIIDQKSFPISYELKYNPSDIQPYSTYAISVRIEGPNKKLLFVNDVQTTVDFTHSALSDVDVAVIRAGESPSTGVKNIRTKRDCGPVKCPGNKPKVCPYGYQKKGGCQICKCNDPCNPPGKPILCGPNQRCFVEKKPDGTFGTRCDKVSSKKMKKTQNKRTPKSAGCRLPKASRQCTSDFQRFYYNAATKTCEQFDSGVCSTNRNNFASKRQCEKICKA